MPTLRDMLLGILLPSLIGLVGGWAATHGVTRPWWRAGLAALGVGLAYAFCRWALWGWKVFPPSSVFDWLAFTALGLGLIAGATAKAPVWLRVILTFALALAVLLPAALRDSGLSTLMVISLGAGLAVVALVSEAAALRAPVSTLAALITAGTVSSVTLLIPLSSASQAQAVGILCASAGGAAGALVFTRRVPVLLATLVVLMLGATLFTQQRFASGSPTVALLLAGSPLGVLLGTLPPLRRHPVFAAAARILGVAVLAGSALALASASATAPSGY